MWVRKCSEYLRKVTGPVSHLPNFQGQGNCMLQLQKRWHMMRCSCFSECIDHHGSPAQRQSWPKVPPTSSGGIHQLTQGLSVSRDALYKPLMHSLIIAQLTHRKGYKTKPQKPKSAWNFTFKVYNYVTKIFKGRGKRSIKVVTIYFISFHIM